MKFEIKIRTRPTFCSTRGWVPLRDWLRFVSRANFAFSIIRRSESSGPELWLETDLFFLILLCNSEIKLYTGDENGIGNYLFDK